MRRRKFVHTLGGIGAGLTTGGAAVAERVSENGGGAAPSTHTVEVESWDGTTLVADLYVPASDEGRHPAIVHTHGSGGTRATVRESAESAARNGYVVLAPDFRGFGDSGGESTLDGPAEVADALVLIDALAGGTFSVRDADETVSVSVRPSSNGPTVGMRGASLGGSIQLLTAAATREWFDGLDDLTISAVEEVIQNPPAVALDLPSADQDGPSPLTYDSNPPDGDAIDAATPHLSLDSSPLDAIVPRIPWRNLERAVAPNGVIKGSWLTFLNLPGRGDVDLAGGPTFWKQAFVALTAAYNKFPPAARAFFARRTPDLEAVARNDVATLVVEEWNDGYCPPEHGLGVYRGIRDAGDDGPPVALTISTLPRPGTHNWEYPWERTGDEGVTRYLDAITAAWLDRFLQSDASAWRRNEFPPISLYQRQYPDVPAEYYDDQWPGWRALDTFPPEGATPTALPLAGASAADRTVLANTAAPASFRGPTGTLFASPHVDAPVASAGFDFAATESVDVAGTPRLSLAVTPLGDDTAVFAKFELVEAGATTGDVVDSQVMPYRIRDSAGERTRIEFDLVPFQRYLDAGDRLRLVLATTDNGYYNSRESAGLVVHHGTPEESALTLDVTADDENPFDGRPLPAGDGPR